MVRKELDEDKAQSVSLEYQQRGYLSPRALEMGKEY